MLSIKPDMLKGQELFDQAFSRWMKQWALVGNFRALAIAGIPYAQVKIGTENLQFAQTEMYKYLLGDKEDNKRYMAENAAKYASKMTEEAVGAGKGGIDCATIVFAHTIIDTAVLDYLRVTAVCAPDAWSENILRRKVAMEEVASCSREELEQKQLDAVLNDWGYRSLKIKAERLLQLTAPHGPCSINRYVFDLDRLSRLDSTRISIVHGDGLGGSVQNVEADIYYLQQTCWFFLAEVNHKYGLKLNPNFELARQKHPT